MASLQSERRIARAEPRLVEVVRFRGQSRPSRYQGLGHLVRRRLAVTAIAQAKMLCKPDLSPGRASAAYPGHPRGAL